MVYGKLKKKGDPNSQPQKHSVLDSAQLEATLSIEKKHIRPTVTAVPVSHEVSQLQKECFLFLKPCGVRVSGWLRQVPII